MHLRTGKKTKLKLSGHYPKRFCDAIAEKHGKNKKKPMEPRLQKKGILAIASRPDQPHDQNQACVAINLSPKSGVVNTRSQGVAGGDFRAGGSWDLAGL